MAGKLTDILHGKNSQEPLPVADEVDDEPMPEVGPCASRATTKWWPGFHAKNATVVAKGEATRKTTRSFDYSHMGYREFLPSGTEFVLEINEPEKWRLRIEGRSLWLIYNLLHQHRLEWIEAAVGRSAMGIADGLPVIERITVQRIEEKE